MEYKKSYSKYLALPYYYFQNFYEKPHDDISADKIDGGDDDMLHGFMFYGQQHIP